MFVHVKAHGIKELNYRLALHQLHLQGTAAGDLCRCRVSYGNHSLNWQVPCQPCEGTVSCTYALMLLVLIVYCQTLPVPCVVNDRYELHTLQAIPVMTAYPVRTRINSLPALPEISFTSN